MSRIKRSLPEDIDLTNTQSPNLTVEERITQLIATYLEGLHNPSDDELYNDLRAKRDTEYLKSEVKRLVLEGRRDELKYWQWKTDGHIELSGKEVDDRLAALNRQIEGLDNAQAS